jgi:RNA ligase
MTEKIFGPEYSKIDTLWKRTERSLVIPGEFAAAEFEYLRNCPWTWTEKIDGINIRLHWDGGCVIIGGREDNAQLPAILVAALAKGDQLNPMRWAAMFPDAEDVTVYGEGYGTGIRSGGQYRPDVSMIVFDVKVGPWWLEEENVADIAGKLGLDVVPKVGTFTPNEAWENIVHDRLTSRWDKAQIEGIVGRPAAALFTRKGERIITKLKVKDWQDYLRAQEAQEKGASRAQEAQEKK